MQKIPDAKRVIPAEVLDLPVRGLRIEGAHLRELVGREATVLAFLRHFG
jgi:hypothetical protein